MSAIKDIKDRYGMYQTYYSATMNRPMCFNPKENNMEMIHPTLSEVKLDGSLFSVCHSITEDFMKASSSGVDKQIVIWEENSSKMRMRADKWRKRLRWWPKLSDAIYTRYYSKSDELSRLANKLRGESHGAMQAAPKMIIKYMLKQLESVFKDASTSLGLEIDYRTIFGYGNKVLTISGWTYPIPTKLLEWAYETIRHIKGVRPGWDGTEDMYRLVTKMTENREKILEICGIESQELDDDWV